MLSIVKIKMLVVKVEAKKGCKYILNSFHPNLQRQVRVVS